MTQFSPSMKWAHPPSSVRSLHEILVESEELESLSPFSGTDRGGEDSKDSPGLFPVLESGGNWRTSKAPGITPILRFKA